MNFKIGAWKYRVRITNEPIYDDAGRQQSGGVYWAERTILISGTIPLELRIDTLLHELCEAWAYHVGHPQPGEDYANSTATFTALAMAELARQGGVASLMRLLPAGRLEHTDDELEQLGDSGGEHYAAQCRACGRMFARLSVVSGKPFFDMGHQAMCLRRTLYCEDCNHLQEWLEGATASGHPNGRVYGEPVFKRGEAVERFAREHAEIAQ
jgi:hypothetical protein